MVTRGPISTRHLSEDAVAALESGDVDALLRASKAEFGNCMVMMATGADDDDDDNDDDDDDTSGDGGDDDNDKHKGSKKRHEDDDDDDSDADAEKLRRRMKAADRRAAEAERKLREREDAEKGDLEKAQGRVSELEQTLKDLQSEVHTLRLNNAFLTSNTQTWHDPDTALALAGSKGYLEGVVDEETGDVDRKAMKKALERLATEHKYLVKSEDKKDDDSRDLPSGDPAGGRSDNAKDDKSKKDAQRKRFPVLNR